MNQWSRIKSSAITVVICFTMVLSAGTVLAGPKGAVGDLYIAEFCSDRIIQVDSITGAVVGEFVTVGLDRPIGSCFGPNGHLFVSNFGDNSNITEYDGLTGAFIRVFLSNLGSPEGLRFKANGNLLVYEQDTESIIEYDPSGGLIGTFASGLSGDITPIDFGPDGNLYVSNFAGNYIQRFDHNGNDLGIFASGGGLNGPEGHAFGPNGNLFVSSFLTNQVIEYDGTTGSVVGTFIDTHVDWPVGMAFSLDGNLWVANLGGFGGNDINEFDGTTGAFIRQVRGFIGGFSITVKPGPTNCLTMTVSTLTSGQNAKWKISGATSGSLIAVVFGFQPGSTIVNDQLGFCATFGIQGINQSKLVGMAVAGVSGNASINKMIPRQAAGMTILTQAAEQGTCPNECVSNLDTQIVQ